ncbi:NeuD/PglB/VioB family sugar acetyltransferase [Pengzhenrongella sicca]|uniref:NeuD/PglB/VioB family sugar acetyltransferase n=1 Tax=Pengzhenrongella sicca TaxID=2819238 RepID=A0A8A4ZHR9_9MICO|nr:NeuD/PglB/VioB family sugar acetyltransferase [Pengzhenrongella sicca]
MFVVGAGGFGRETLSILHALAADGGLPPVTGVIDDDPARADLDRIEELGQRVVGTVADLARRTGPFGAVLAIGSAPARRRIADLLAGTPVRYPVVVHPDATIGRLVHLAEGVVVAPGARLSTNVLVGRHVQIDQNAVVGHDCVLEEFARLNPQVCVSGAVRIGSGALVGAAATVLPGLSVGADAIVGAGAVVTRSVAPGAVVKGVPAR